MQFAMYSLFGSMQFARFHLQPEFAGLNCVCFCKLRPTLKMPTDDMTKSILAVNMHAVRHWALSLTASMCPSSSIG